MNFLYPVQTMADYTFEVKNYTNDPSLLQTAPDLSGAKMIYTESAASKGAPVNLKLKDLANNNVYRVNETADEVGDFAGKIDGNKVAYTAYRSGYNQVVIADMTNPASPVYHQITNDTTSKYSVDISGNNVIYVSVDQESHIANVFFADITDIDNPDIYQLTGNNTTGTFFLDTSISGRNVSWTLQAGGDLNIMYEDVTLPNFPDGPYLIDGPTRQYGARLDGDNLVYVELDAGETTATYKRKVIGGSTNTLATKSCGTNCMFETIAISGEKVIYTAGNGVYFNNVAGGQEEEVTSNPDFEPYYAAISGTITAWEGVKDYTDRDIFGTGSLNYVANTPIYRFWSDTYSGHFYTVSESERDYIIANDPNWRYEGATYNAFTGDNDVRMPVYRFWSSNYRHHFYTISEAEKNYVIANDPNWSFEGVAYYGYSSQIPNSTPLYRFWSDAYKGHFYTSDASEKNNIIVSMPEWHYEGAAYYVPTGFGSGK